MHENDFRGEGYINGYSREGDELFCPFTKNKCRSDCVNAIGYYIEEGDNMVPVWVCRVSKLIKSNKKHNNDCKLSSLSKYPAADQIFILSGYKNPQWVDIVKSMLLSWGEIEIISKDGTLLISRKYESEDCFNE